MYLLNARTLIWQGKSTMLKEGDNALVDQYRGPRLPEGATKLPEGATIQWLFVSIL